MAFNYLTGQQDLPELQPAQTSDGYQAIPTGPSWAGQHPTLNKLGMGPADGGFFGALGNAAMRHRQAGGGGIGLMAALSPDFSKKLSSLAGGAGAAGAALKF